MPRPQSESSHLDAADAATQAPQDTRVLRGDPRIVAFRKRWKWFISDGRPEQIREDGGRALLIKIVKMELAEAMAPKAKPQTARQYWENVAKEYGSIEDLPCLDEECQR